MRTPKKITTAMEHNAFRMFSGSVPAVNASKARAGEDGWHHPCWFVGQSSDLRSQLVSKQDRSED
jgi:hypothetical protein